MSQSDESLVRLIRTIVDASIAKAVASARIPKVLSGSVEDLDEDLDVAFVRMDQEASGGDPTQSDNFEAPGIIPTTRLGETLVGEQVRVSFDGKAGASAQRASTENRIILPSGAESGNRIVFDGQEGFASFGDDTAPGARIVMDAVGGLRIRSANDTLVTILDQQGYTLNDPVSGLVVIEIRPESIRLVDPAGTDDIELVNSSTGSLPNPKYTSAIEANPSSSIVVPLAATFTFTPADDIELYHAAAFLADVVQSATFTPPSGATERIDADVNPAGSTLAVSVATRDPASGVAGTFTSSQTNWKHGLGTHVVIRGGGTTSPSFRSVSELEFSTTANESVLTFTKPSGVVEGDAMVAFVAVGNDGGSVPLGWTVPEGWVFLGANFILSGSGAGMSMLGVGAWAKRAGAAEPATTDVTIKWSPGTKTVHGAVVAIQNPDLIDGGPHIRIAGHPIRRLLAFTELTAANTVLADFQNIPPGYDHLELQWDGSSDIGTDVARRLRLRMNADTGSNYHYRIVQDGISVAHVLATTRILHGAINGANAGHTTSGILNMFGYARTGRERPVLGHNTWTETGVIHDESHIGRWTNTANPINRLTLEVDATGAGIVKFATGSRAYLYGY